MIILFNEINIKAVSDFVFDEKKYRGLFPKMDWERLDINLAAKDHHRLDLLISRIRSRLKKLPYAKRCI